MQKRFGDVGILRMKVLLSEKSDASVPDSVQRLSYQERVRKKDPASPSFRFFPFIETG